MRPLMRLAGVSAVLCLLSAVAHAGQEDAIPGCYDKRLPPRSGTINTEIFVMIDQTTPLDLELRQSVADNLKPFLGPNNGFSVSTFSAYTQGHYTQVLVSGKLDPLLDVAQRNDISKPLLAKFDQCMAAQPRMATQLAGAALRSAFEGTSGEIARSDVIASIKAISSRVKSSPAKNRVVLLVSDMLENSSISSFYADKGQSVRKIEPEKEMKLVNDNQLLADFGDAKIYVIGAGLLSDDASKAKRYRDPKTMQALFSFWKMYFSKSNAQLIEFGQPALLNPITASAH
jgi:hypothetical protein